MHKTKNTTMNISFLNSIHDLSISDYSNINNGRAPFIFGE
jgi:hypothetical protein